MKKLLASAVCLGMILSSAVLFTGCGERIYIDGDFSKEATAEEVDAVLASVRANEDVLFGDTTEEDWSYAMRLIGDTSVKLDIRKEEATVLTMDASGKAELNGEYDAQGLRASGSVQASAETTFGTETGKTGMDGNVYLDSSGLYLDGSYESIQGEESVSLNGKYHLPASTAGSAGIEIPDLAQIGDDILEALGSTGAKVYIDAGDAETKVKVSFDLNGLLSSDLLPDAGTEIAALFEAVEFDCYDVYFSFLNETGELTGYGYVAGASIPETAVGSGKEAVTISMDVSASEWYLAGDAEVNAPSDPDSYQQPGA